MERLCSDYKSTRATIQLGKTNGRTMNIYVKNIDTIKNKDSLFKEPVKISEMLEENNNNIVRLNSKTKVVTPAAKPPAFQISSKKQISPGKTEGPSFGKTLKSLDKNQEKVSNHKYNNEIEFNLPNYKIPRVTLNPLKVTSKPLSSPLPASSDRELVRPVNPAPRKEKNKTEEKKDITNKKSNIKKETCLVSIPRNKILKLPQRKEKINKKENPKKKRSDASQVPSTSPTTYKSQVENIQPASRSQESRNLATRSQGYPNLAPSILPEVTLADQVPDFPINPVLLDQWTCPESFEDLFRDVVELCVANEPQASKNQEYPSGEKGSNAESEVPKIDPKEQSLDNNVVEQEGISAIPLSSNVQNRPYVLAKLPGGPWVQIPLGSTRYRLRDGETRWCLRLNPKTGFVRRVKKTGKGDIFSKF